MLRGDLKLWGYKNTKRSYFEKHERKEVVVHRNECGLNLDGEKILKHFERLFGFVIRMK